LSCSAEFEKEFIMASLLKCLRRVATITSLVAAAALVGSMAGCERKEKVIDIEAPGVDIEVNKTRDGVEIEGGGKKKVDIEAPGVDIEIKK
jgi:hypothetical protein